METLILSPISYMETAAEWVTRLKSLMLDDNLNQSEIAQRVGLHRSTISKYFETGNLQDDFLLRLEKFVGYRPDYIRTGKGEKRIARSQSINTNTNTNTVHGGNVTTHTGTSANNDEVARLKEELYREKMKALEEKIRLQEEIIKLQRGEK